MATSLKRILVAIRDLRHAPKSELGKAAALARAAGARLELFHAIDEPDPAAGWPETTTAKLAAQHRAAIADRKRQRLEQFARDDQFKGLHVECTASWDHPPHEAIIRRARLSHAGLVIAVTRHHRMGARLLLRNTDWELIRHCPTPLLLVRSGRAYRKPSVIAAVDPFHARPAGLDARLLAAGGSLARLLHGTLHIFHAYMPLVSAAPPGLGAHPLMMLPPEAEAAHGAQVARAIDKLADGAAVPRARRHVQMGDVAGELRAAVAETGAGLVVMGAVSRSALARVFVGNSAERVLDRLTCDLLIVKPRGFRSKVERRAATAVPRSPHGHRSPGLARRLASASNVTTMRVMLPPVF
ncbi:MAG TPA: universal stress protein [Steroidobacteraceae bacterium]|jgi:universal stress protein E|nr:universal stress protein [Steroidobacteraceae bacterium]